MLESYGKSFNQPKGDIMRVIENHNLSEIEQTIADYLTNYCKVQAGIIYCGEYSENNWIFDKWSITLIRQGVKGSFNFEYKTGTGHRDKKGFNGETVAVKPALAGLIYSLIMSGDSCQSSFTDWCGNYGYDTDSRKAFSIYEACQNEYNKLQSIFTNNEIEHMQELLEDY